MRGDCLASDDRDTHRGGMPGGGGCNHNLLMADGVGDRYRAAPPIGRQYAFPDMPMDTAVRPIGGPGHVSVLDRIPMDVIHVMDEILFVADAVFPKAALPNGLFTFVSVAGECGGASFGGNAGGERAFDVAPPHGKIGVVRRQCPHGVEVVGQDDDGVNPERTAGHFLTERRA